MARTDRPMKSKAKSSKADPKRPGKPGQAKTTKPGLTPKNKSAGSVKAKAANEKASPAKATAKSVSKKTTPQKKAAATRVTEKMSAGKRSIGTGKPTASSAKTKPEGKTGSGSQLKSLGDSKLAGSRSSKKNTPEIPTKPGKKIGGKLEKPKSAKAANGAKLPSDIALEVTLVEKSTLNGRRILRPKFFPDYPTEKAFGHQSETPEIPAAYGHDKLVLMPKDPEWLFTYWELTPKTVESGWHQREHGHQYQEAMKLSWEPHGLFEPNYVFLPVEFTARKWYLTIPGDTSKSFRVEIGWLGENGHFISLLKSQSANLPETWVQTRERIIREGKVSAFTAKRTVQLGASENAVISESRAVFELENLSSDLFSSSSLAMASRTAPEKSMPSLEPTAKIEITGSLPKGSLIRAGGREYTPNAKGVFKVTLETQEPTLHLEVVSSEGEARFIAYDLSTPTA